jgi:hypothetical protein
MRWEDKWHTKGRKERNHFEDGSVDGRVILKLMLKKLTWIGWTGFIWHVHAPRRRLSPALYTEFFYVDRVSDINSSSQSLKILPSAFWKHCT